MNWSGEADAARDQNHVRPWARRPASRRFQSNRALAARCRDAKPFWTASAAASRKRLQVAEEAHLLPAIPRTLR
jgi:hypothetical protein